MYAFKSPVTLDERVIGTVGFARDITARKNAEAALRESEEQFRTLTTLAPVGIYLTDAQGQCIYVNSRWCEMAGMKPHEALGDGWKNALHPEDRDKVFASWEKMVASQGKWGTEYRFKTREGKTTWVYALASPLRDAAGEVVKYLGINMDITERKQLEQELERYRDHLEGEVSSRTLELAKSKEVAELTSHRLRVSEERLSAIFVMSQKATQLDERELWQMGIEEAVRLTGSEIGYLHFVNDDQETLELCTWSQGTLKHCAAAYDSHYPVSAAGVWADSVRFRRSVIHNDYQTLTGRKGYPDGHAHLIRHIGVPVIEGDKVRVLMGVGNKVTDYDATDVNQLQLIGNDLWLIVMRRRAEVALAEAKAAKPGESWL